MIELVVIYIIISFVIAVVNNLSEKLIGSKEINMICSLCVISIVLLPLAKYIPQIVSTEKIPDLELESVTTQNDYEQYKIVIKDSIEKSVVDMIANEFKINSTVKADMNFDDISSIKLEKIKVYIDPIENKGEIYDLIKSVYFCEVMIIDRGD